MTNMRQQLEADDAHASLARLQQSCGRRWTRSDEAYLRRHWLTRPTPVVAAALGRSVQALRQHAHVLGLADRYVHTADVADDIRRLHAEGKSDPEIARALRLSRDVAQYHRCRLGLPAVQLPPGERRRRAAAGYRRWLAEQGFQSLTEMRQLQMVALCHARGWPGAFTPGQCDVLDLLEERGAMCRPDIGHALGVHSTKCVWEKLQRLAGTGLVVRLGRAGRRGVLYGLAPGVHRLRRAEYRDLA